MASVPIASPAAPRRNATRIDAAKWVLGGYVAVFLFLVALPIALVIVISFSPTPFVSFPVKGLSWRWYVRVYEYQPFMSSLLTSVELAVASSIAGAVVAVPFGLALGRSRSAWAAAAVLFLLSPLSVPGIVIGFSLLYFLSSLAIGPGFPALFIAHTLIAIPYIARTVLSVYRTLPPGSEEAAVILGATRWQTLRHVTLPQLRPAVFAGMLFALLISLDNLPISFFFGTAATNTLPVVMMSYLQNQFDPSVAAIATIQMLLAVIALVAADRLYGIGRISPA